MTDLVIQDLDDETHAGLQELARRNGRSLDEEVRAALKRATKVGPGLGTRLLEIGQRYGGVDLDITRDQTPPRVVTFD